MYNNDLLKWFILLIGILFSSIVFSFLIRKKINEKNTLVWLGSSVLILILAVNPGLLDRIAAFIGIDYPPALLFLLSVLVLLMLNLYQSVQISMLHDKLVELSQYIALQEAKDQRRDARDPSSDNGS